MAQLTPEQFAQGILNSIKSIESGRALQVAAQSVHAERVVRIFDKGIEGAKYSDRSPIYISPTQTRSGKGGKFANYAAFKNSIGFDGGKVNLRVTNDLQMDFANSRVNTGASRADAGQVIKVNNFLFIEEIRSQENVKKLNDNLKRFGNFIAVTPKEEELFNRVLDGELKRDLQNG
jgi:hypothetical protein